MNEKKKPILKLVVDGKEKEVSFEQLTLANNASLEAIMRLLVRKRIIKPQEFVTELKAVEKERYRFGKLE